jgi:hypothetical protein
LAGIADSPADVLPPNTFLIQFVIFFISVGFSGIPDGKSAPELPAASPVQQGKSEKFRKNEFFSCGIPQFRPILVTLDNHTNPTSTMRHLPYTLIVLAAATGFASAQATSYTDPVGYVTLNIDTTNNSQTYIGAPLYNEVLYSGVVTSHAANSLTVGGTPFAVNQFDGFYFVEITNGSGEGVWTDIATTPSSSEITTNDDLSTFITDNTTTIKIRKHHTIESLFGDPNTPGDQNNLGLVAAEQIVDADTLLLLDPVTQIPTTIFFNNGEFGTGWETGSFTNKADMIVAPGQGILVTRAASGTGAATFVQEGSVKTGKTVLVVEAGENLIAPPRATGVTFDDSTLGSVIDGGEQIAAADQVVYNSGPNTFESLFFNNGEFGTGWETGGFVPRGSSVITEGTAINIQNTFGAGAFNWTIPAQPIATP